MSYTWNDVEQIFSKYLIDNYSSELLSENIQQLLENINTDNPQNYNSLENIFPNIKTDRTSIILFILVYFRKLGYEINLKPFESEKTKCLFLYRNDLKSELYDILNDIPNEVKLNKSNLEGIEDIYFKDNQVLRSVELPDTIINFNNVWTFLNCQLLKSIKLPSNLTRLPLQTFEYCPSLTDITIPQSIKSIGAQVFRSCDSLTTIKYEGTQKQWMEIKKSPFWNQDSSIQTITCTDGVVKV